MALREKKMREEGKRQKIKQNEHKKSMGGRQTGVSVEVFSKEKLVTTTLSNE